VGARAGAGRGAAGGGPLRPAGGAQLQSDPNQAPATLHGSQAAAFVPPSPHPRDPPPPTRAAPTSAAGAQAWAITGSARGNATAHTASVRATHSGSHRACSSPRRWGA
jgi:hypothetical protein